MDGGTVVRDDTQIRSLSHDYADLVALWTVSSERGPLSAASSARRNAQIVKEDGTKPLVDARSTFVLHDIPQPGSKATRPPSFMGGDEAIRSLESQPNFKMPELDDSSSSTFPSSSPISRSGLRASERSDIDVGPLSKRKRATSPENSEEASSHPRSYDISDLTWVTGYSEAQYIAPRIGKRGSGIQTILPRQPF